MLTMPSKEYFDKKSKGVYNTNDNREGFKSAKFCKEDGKVLVEQGVDSGVGGSDAEDWHTGTMVTK